MKKNWSSSNNRIEEERFSRRYIRHFNIDFEEARLRLTNTRVQVYPLVDIDVSALKSFLRFLGIQDVSRDADIMIPISDSYQTSAALDHCVKNCKAKDILCLPIKAGVVSFIGPFIEPHADFCWGCFKQNLNRHNSVARSLLSLSSTSTYSVDTMEFPSLVSNRWFDFAVRILLHHIFNTSDAAIGQYLFVINSATGDEEVHHNVKWMLCDECSRTAQLLAAVPLNINQDLSLDAILDSASDTTLEPCLHALQRITSPYTGILSTLQLDTKQQNEPGFFTAISRHPLYNRLPSELPATTTERITL